MATRTGKVYKGRKSKKDYNNQSFRLLRYANKSKSITGYERAMKAAMAADERANDIVNLQYQEKQDIKAENAYNSGNLDKAVEISSKAASKKYSTTKRAVDARRRRAMGQNGG